MNLRCSRQTFQILAALLHVYRSMVHAVEIYQFKSDPRILYSKEDVSTAIVQMRQAMLMQLCCESAHCTRHLLCA